MGTLAIAVGVWIIVGLLVGIWLQLARLVNEASSAEQPLAPEALRGSANGHPKPALDASWSPEGWERPDSEVTLSDADEFLRRRYNPTDDDA